MRKEEIALIIFNVSADGQEAINLKIYKNGTTCRKGAGGLPQLGISGMSFFDDSRYFDPVIKKVPQEILNQPINYEEKTPNGYLEYLIAFYGASTNGDTGERANWSKSTGVRVRLDQKSRFNHPIMGFLDGLTLDACELTNEWYFDVMMQVVYKAKSATLPKETILAVPETDEEIKFHFENYVCQILQNTRRWDMRSFIENKTYEIEGRQCKGIIKQHNNSIRVSFYPENGTEEKRKPIWKFW